MVNRISVAEERYVLVFKTERALLSLGMEQCILAMEVVGDSGRRGVLYGFITMG